MSLSASVCSRLQYQHETIHELLNGSSEDILLQHIHKVKWSAQNARIKHIICKAHPCKCG
jgi:hypothetical protein